MGGTIRARVRRGLLEPLEKIDLPEGKEVTIAVLESPTELNVDAFRRAAGSWKGSVDAPKLIRNIYGDRKSTRLNSSHSQISYAVFCLKKKKKTKEIY